MKQLTLPAMLIVSSIMTINLSAETTQQAFNSANNHINGHDGPKLKIQTSSTAQHKNNHAWISIGSDAYAKLLKSNLRQSFQINSPTDPQLTKKQTEHAKVISLPESQLSALSEYMHQEFNRCGGYIYHESFEQAFDYIAQTEAIIKNQQTPFSMQDVSSATLYTIDNPEAVNKLLAPLASATLDSTVSNLSSYHNRYYTQQTGVDSANWINSQWQSISQNRSDINVENYAHSWAQPSVVATITGTLLPDEIVIIGGHLDSINSSSPATGRAPGADDNASGIAVVTEALRAIVASGYKPARTIKLMGYAAEEVGLRGSKAIAQEFRETGKQVVGVVQFDMTGNQGSPGKDIVFMTDYTSSAQNNFMMQLIDTYLSDLNYSTSACGYGCSDHASWHNEGFAASIPFESTMGDANRAIHTTNDTAFDSSHAFNFARLAVTYLAELAKSDDWEVPPDNSQLENGVPVFNLAANRNNALEYKLDVPPNAQNIQFNINGGSGDADLYVKFGSMPTDSSYDCRPYKNGNNETCNMTQTGGTYFVRVKAYSDFSGVTLVGQFDDDIIIDPPDPIDQTFSEINLAKNEWYYQSIELSAGYETLTVSISGGTGDADLYLRKGAKPTTNSYDCRPYKNGNDESCNVDAPESATWHIGIRGYRASNNVTLSIKAIPRDYL